MDDTVFISYSLASCASQSKARDQRKLEDQN